MPTRTGSTRQASPRPHPEPCPHPELFGTRPAADSDSLRGMTQLVLTAIGDDRGGLVSALSEQVDRCGGNWLESGLSHLAGKFAGVVLVEVPEDRVQELTEALDGLHQSVGLRVDVTDAQLAGDEPGATASEPLRLHLVGQDRTGMVREVTSALAAQQASIEDLRTWTSDAPQGGGVLFEAEALVKLPADRDPAEVREALETIAAELMVDLDLDEPS